jgi:hypothetical protein
MMTSAGIATGTGRGTAMLVDRGVILRGVQRAAGLPHGVRDAMVIRPAAAIRLVGW